MLGSIILTADVTATTAVFATVAGLAMSFRVEEEEMVVSLEFQGVVSNDNAAGRVDLDFNVDGTRVSGATAGLMGYPSVSSVLAPVHMVRVVRLSKGDHTLALQWKAAAGVNTLAATTFPAQLVVRRMSHPATLGQGVNSKVQLAV